MGWTLDAARGADPAWLWALAGAAAKGAALLIAAGVLVAGAQRASAAMRHLIWTVALVATLGLPFVPGLVPSISMPVPAPLAALLATVSQAGPTADADAIGEAPRAIGTRPTVPVDLDRPADRTRLTETNAPAPGTAGVSASAPAIDWPALLLLIWLAGAAISLLRFAVGLTTAWWISRRATPVVDASWRHLLHDLSDRLGLVRAVRLLRSTRASVPMTWGWARPVVLLPVDANTWTDECREAVLAHELAHVQRRDCAIQAIAQLACAVYWFNPLVWIAAQRLRVERERACDDQVLTLGTRPSDYATRLLDIARSQPMEWAAAATMAMARRSELEGRLMAILDPDVKRAIPRTVRALTVVTVALLALAVAAVEPSARAPQPITAPGDAFAPVSAPAEIDLDLNDLDLDDLGIDREIADASAEAVRNGQTSDRVIDAFITAMADPEPSVRRQAARALGRVRDERAREALAGTLTSDSDAEVREAAAWALGRARSQQAAAALAMALDDEAADVRQQAAWALGASRAAGAVNALVATLRDRDPDVQEQAAWALGAIGDAAATDGLRAALQEGGAGARQQAAWALGALRDAGAVTALVGALDDDDPDVQEQAAWALGAIRDASAVDGLLAALTSAGAGARQQAAWALGSLRSERAVDGLIVALGDTDGDVQQQAAWALGAIRDARALASLTAALADAADDARQQAA